MQTSLSKQLMVTFWIEIRYLILFQIVFDHVRGKVSPIIIRNMLWPGNTVNIHNKKGF